MPFFASQGGPLTSLICCRAASVEQVIFGMLEKCLWKYKLKSKSHFIC